MNNLETALLKIINDRGTQVRNSQIYKALEDGNYFELQKHHLRETIYGGRPAYQHEVRSYLSNLVQEGRIRRLSRGEHEITESGKSNIGAPNVGRSCVKTKNANLNKDSEKEFLKQCYPLCAKLNKHPTWWFGAMKSRIDSRLKSGALVLFCDDHTRHEKIFHIPFDYLQSHILNRVQPDSKGAYKFHINKKTHVFTWGRKGNMIKMDGARFLT